jgi:mannitol-1-/sugar-/sorbitol-6-phosphatase
MTLSCRAVLFDLDGVLVDSREAVERQWRVWAAEHGVDMDSIRPVMHGVRGAEAVAAVAPRLDAEAEAALIDRAQALDLDGVVALDGAAALVGALPPGSWTVVTSGRHELAEARLRHVGLPVPDSMVCAEDVARGKPEPDGYLLAASRLGVPPADCVVLEDAPAGVAAARAGGMRVVGVSSTHEPGELQGADAVVSTLEAVRPAADGVYVDA